MPKPHNNLTQSVRPSPALLHLFFLTHFFCFHRISWEELLSASYHHTYLYGLLASIEWMKGKCPEPEGRRPFISNGLFFTAVVVLNLSYFPPNSLPKRSAGTMHTLTTCKDIRDERIVILSSAPPPRNLALSVVWYGVEYSPKVINPKTI